MRSRVRVHIGLLALLIGAGIPATPARAGCPDPRPVTANVSGDTTWENWVPDPACADYAVQVDVVLNDEVLTIEPGTVVAFEAGKGLRVRGTAGLVAAGTGADPIVLTGTTKERGHWKGVVIGGRTFDRHVLTFTTIEWTGGGAVSGTKEAGLMLNRDVKVKLEYNTLRQSAGYGMFLAARADVTGAGGNTMTENALGPAYTYASQVADVVAGGGSRTGNDVDEVTVYPDTILDTAVWTKGAYRVIRYTSQSFAVKGSLTLGPGVVLRFEPNQKMRVMSGGGLAAVGTAEDPVVFTGVVETAGSWGGLYFYDTDNPVNRLDHVVIEYGGGEPIGTLPGANLVLTHGTKTASRVAVSNTTLRRGQGYGLYAKTGSSLVDFTGNTLTQNLAGAAYVGAPMVGDLKAGNIFTGNTEDEIRVQTGTNQTITESATWRNFGVPYYLQYINGPTTVVDGASITIEPGVEILIGAGVGLTFQDRASLTAIGTPDNKITIEAKIPGAFWRGISVIDSSAKFDWIDISGAGGGTMGGNMPGTVTILTHDLDDAPSSSASFGTFATLEGVGYGIVFGYGDTFAGGCGNAGTVFVQKGDKPSEHCQ